MPCRRHKHQIASVFGLQANKPWEQEKELMDDQDFHWHFVAVEGLAEDLILFVSADHNHSPQHNTLVILARGTWSGASLVWPRE